MCFMGQRKLFPMGAATSVDCTVCDTSVSPALSCDAPDEPCVLDRSQLFTSDDCASYSCTADPDCSTVKQEDCGELPDMIRLPFQTIFRIDSTGQNYIGADWQQVRSGAQTEDEFRRHLATAGPAPTQVFDGSVDTAQKCWAECLADNECEFATFQNPAIGPVCAIGRANPSSLNIPSTQIRLESRPDDYIHTALKAEGHMDQINILGADAS
jgi:hypothetical protein